MEFRQKKKASKTAKYMAAKSKANKQLKREDKRKLCREINEAIKIGRKGWISPIL